MAERSAVKRRYGPRDINTGINTKFTSNEAVQRFASKLEQDQDKSGQVRRDIFGDGSRKYEEPKKPVGLSDKQQGALDRIRAQNAERIANKNLTNLGPVAKG